MKMKSFLLILSMIFAFGIVLTSSSITYSDYIYNSIKSSDNNNQLDKTGNYYSKNDKDTTPENFIPVITQ